MQDSAAGEKLCWGAEGRVRDVMENLEQVCRDLNAISAWLAYDDRHGWKSYPWDHILTITSAIVWLGNQVVPTLTRACQLIKDSPVDILVLSGGAGHSTPMLFANLRNSEYGWLVEEGAILPSMGEAEMASVVAERAFGLKRPWVMVEERSTNCGENARFCQYVFEWLEFDEEWLVLLQDPTMQRRSFATWEREKMRARRPEQAVVSYATFVPEVEPGPDGLPQLIAGQRDSTWTIERYVGLLMGEMERLRDDENGYGPRGRDYFDHVEMPDEVWEAYLRVKGSGVAEMARR